MSQHILSLDIPTTTNPKTFRVVDTSEYIANIAATSCFIQIVPPGSNSARQYTVQPGFNLIVNASNLRIMRAKKESDLTDLPDGIYTVKYSVCPNDKNFVEYYYLHNAGQYQRYIALICDLYSKRKFIPYKEFGTRRNELWKIGKIIKDAKGLVEECGKDSDGLNLYKEATQLLDSYQTNCNDCH